MNLGEKILKLRKDFKFSQEQLSEKIGVSRQTISNWELGLTSPNPEQLKLLAKNFNVSIDELLDNDIKKFEKISNTEKLAGIVIKILKVIGIIFIMLLIIDIIALIFFTTVKKDVVSENVLETEILCSIGDNDYIINIGNDGYFNCSNCEKKLQKELKDNYIDFSDIEKSTLNINEYFKNNQGICN